MTILNKFKEIAKIEFVEYGGELELSTLNTSDGYDLYFFGYDVSSPNWETEIFYYKPDLMTIMDGLDRRDADEIMEITCYDVDEFFEDYELEDWLRENMDEDEFDTLMDEVQ